MAVTHAAATRTSIADAVLADIDAGSNALIELQTSGGSEVATLTCSATAGVVSGAVLTFNAITDDTSATGGTTTKAEIQTSAAATVVLCSVGSGSGDIDLSSTVIGTGDTVSISALTYTAPV